MGVVEQPHLLRQRQVTYTCQVAKHRVDLLVAGLGHVRVVHPCFVLTVHPTTLQPAGPFPGTDRSRAEIPNRRISRFSAGMGTYLGDCGRIQAAACVGERPGCGARCPQQVDIVGAGQL